MRLQLPNILISGACQSTGSRSGSFPDPGSEVYISYELLRPNRSHNKQKLKLTSEMYTVGLAEWLR